MAPAIGRRRSPKRKPAILQRVQEGVDKPKPKVLFEPGEVVRVTDGPFNDFNGVVEEVDYDKSRRKVVGVDFGRSTPVRTSRRVGSPREKKASCCVTPRSGFGRVEDPL